MHLLLQNIKENPI